MKQHNHICGTCEEGFDTQKGYVEHKCSTGFKPDTIEHLDATSDGKYSLVSAKALERGEAKK